METSPVCTNSHFSLLKRPQLRVNCEKWPKFAAGLAKKAPRIARSKSHFYSRNMGVTPISIIQLFPQTPFWTVAIMRLKNPFALGLPYPFTTSAAMVFRLPVGFAAPEPK